LDEIRGDSVILGCYLVNRSFLVFENGHFDYDIIKNEGKKELARGKKEEILAHFGGEKEEKTLFFS